jgi:MFS family permease
MTGTAQRTTSPFAMIIALGCLICMIAFGVRSTAGLFAVPMTSEFGWSREAYGFAFALQNLMWGAAQPFAGAFADRLGTVRVVVIGAIVYAAGVLLMAFGGNLMTLNLGGGILMGLGIATTSFSVIMPAFGRLVPAEKRSWAFGMATSASSVGQLVFAPLGQQFIDLFGWQIALVALAVFLALIIPMVLPFARAGVGGKPTVETDPVLPLTTVIAKAFGHPSYLLLVAGFFVCGFHVAFITVHLPPYLTDIGLSKTVASWSIGLIGLFNIIGAYSSGIYGGRHSKRYGLSFIYFARALVIFGFISLPITAASALVFSALMGLLWLSTVPLTMGLVTVMFGTRNMAMLYGFVFLNHQLGSFLGVWLGGRFYDQYGDYNIIWWTSIALGIASALIHWPIKESPAAPATAPAQ